MKGLLIKDLCLLKGQKKFWLGILLISVFFLGVYDNPSFVVCYMSIMAAMFTSSTLSYDEFQNGMSYLMTLPVDRKGYVQEKYMFGLLISLIATCLGYAVTFVAGIVMRANFENGELASSAVAGMMIAMIIIAITVPLQLKFGSEKGRMALLTVYGLAALSGFLLVKCLNIIFGGKISLNDIFAALDRFLGNSFIMVALFLLGVGGIFILVSYFLSVSILRKKQF